MVNQLRAANKRLVDEETGTIKKDFRGRIKVALVYPNTYNVGMSSLGFQTIYSLLNKNDNVVCERAFLPPESSFNLASPKTIESSRPLSDFDVIAFSISFENDYQNILTILKSARIPFLARERSSSYPLVMAGGVACFLNPEPISDFFDCFIIGEAEPIIGRFFEIFNPEEERKKTLKMIASELDGVYVPLFYEVTYNNDKTINSFEPIEHVKKKIKRIYSGDLSKIAATTSSIITPNTAFARTYLMEVGRGCPYGCRFCSVGYVYRPPRFKPVSQLKEMLREGMEITDRIGLVGSAITDYPGLKDLLSDALEEKIRLSFSSLRADRLSSEIISALAQSSVKTATIAPDAGSDRMRKVINKKLSEESILSAAENLVLSGILNLKLYFMIGLPTESEEDIEELTLLCRKIKQVFLKSSRKRKRIGTITISINSFVPKPFTPFQYAPMQKISLLKKKIEKIRNYLKNEANLLIHAENPRNSFVQALLSRGDRTVSQILISLNQNQNNWAKTLKQIAFNPDFYAQRQRAFNELLPWQHIDHGFGEDFLYREFLNAIKT